MFGPTRSWNDTNNFNILKHPFPTFAKSPAENGELIFEIYIDFHFSSQPGPEQTCIPEHN